MKVYNILVKANARNKMYVILEEQPNFDHMTLITTTHKKKHITHIIIIIIACACPVKPTTQK